MSVENVVQAVSDSELLKQLRHIFTDAKYVGVDSGIKAYILPRSDSHKSEYLSESDLHVQFISGFSGSNAFVVVTDKEALLWTDGRYFDQASKELRNGWRMMKEGVPEYVDPIDWVCNNLIGGSAIAEAKNLLLKTENVGIKAVPIKQNLVEAIWFDRPEFTLRKMIALSDEKCGENAASKVERVREKMREQKCDTIVITSLDDVAWLLNIRGFDVPYNPVVFSTVILNFTDVFLFVDNRKITPEVARHLENVKIYPYEQAVEFLEQYHKQLREQCPNHRVWIPNNTNYAMAAVVAEQQTMIELSPVQLMKVQKNDVELTGLRNAGIRDSAAHIQFLLWLNREMELGHHVTEDRAAKQIDYYRSQLEGYISPSFKTISAVGENASLPHYTHTAESSRLLLRDLPAVYEDVSKQNQKSSAKEVTSNRSNDGSMDTIYLIDSGGQFHDGTTDVTRTIHVGSAPADEHFRRMFTLVLKGHIDLAALLFPSGTSGIRLESFARQAQWRYGYDFIHSIGHGVGHFLNVHEYPPFIGYRVLETAKLPIMSKMVHTIEPGYYETGRFGIRIENSYETVAVSPEKLPSKAKNFLKYVPLTWIPIQKSLIVPELLDAHEVQWVNAYHNRCLEVIGKYLQKRGLQAEYNFLAEACTPI